MLYLLADIKQEIASLHQQRTAEIQAEDAVYPRTTIEDLRQFDKEIEQDNDKRQKLVKLSFDPKSYILLFMRCENEHHHDSLFWGYSFRVDSSQHTQLHC